MSFLFRPYANGVKKKSGHTDLFLLQKTRARLLSLATTFFLSLFLLAPIAHADITDGLKGWWKLDETSGNAIDSSGQGNTGVPTGTTIETGCKKNGCRSYNAINDQITATFAWAPTAFSVNFWLYPISLSDYNQQLTSSAGWDYFVFHATADGRIYCGTDIPTRFSGTELGVNTIELNVWQNFAYTYDGTNGRFYKNGVLLAGPKAQVSPLAWTTFNFGPGGANRIDGKLDDVRLYSRALSLSEVNAIYLSGEPKIIIKGGAKISGLKMN